MARTNGPRTGQKGGNGRLEGYHAWPAAQLMSLQTLSFSTRVEIMTEDAKCVGKPQLRGFVSIFIAQTVNFCLRCSLFSLMWRITLRMYKSLSRRMEQL